MAWWGLCPWHCGGLFNRPKYDGHIIRFIVHDLLGSLSMTLWETSIDLSMMDTLYGLMSMTWWGHCKVYCPWPGGVTVLGIVGDCSIDLSMMDTL